MTLKSVISGIVHSHAEPELTAVGHGHQPWFQVLNSHQGRSACPGFAVLSV